MPAKICMSPRRDVEHSWFIQKTHMLDSLQIFAGPGVGMRERERRAIFFGGGVAVSLLFQQLAERSREL